MLALTTNTTGFSTHACPNKTSRKQTKMNKRLPARPYMSCTSSQSYLWADVWDSPVHFSCCSAPMSHLSLICCCDDFCPVPLQK